MESTLTISVHTRILASSKKRATRKAAGREVTSLTVQAEGESADVAWVTSGELDGSPSLEDMKAVREKS